MNIDLEQEIRVYAQYLDEILPTITSEDLGTAALPVALERSRAIPPWYQRPVVVFLAAVAAVLAVAAPLMLIPLNGTNVAEAPEGVALVVAADVEPVRVATVLGDIELTTLRFPPDHESFFFGELGATAYGLVAVEDSSLWWSTDYETWQMVPIDMEATRLVIAGDDLVVYGETNAARFVWDGAGWAQEARLDITDSIQRITFGPRGAVAVGGAAIYYSTDGVRFVEAAQPPEMDVFVAAENVPEEDRDFLDCRATFGASTSAIRTIFSTYAGFVALTSATHPDGVVCAPLLWFSADGDTWDLVSPNSPFGELSAIRGYESWVSIAEQGHRFVAIGEVGGQGRGEIQGAVWISEDGVDWQRADIELNAAFIVAGGEMGWILVGSVREGPADLWFSVDGHTWDGPHELPEALEFGWFPPQIAVGSDAFFALGSDETAVIGRLHDQGR